MFNSLPQITVIQTIQNEKNVNSEQIFWIK